MILQKALTICLSQKLTQQCSVLMIVSDSLTQSPIYPLFKIFKTH